MPGETNPEPEWTQGRLEIRRWLAEYAAPLEGIYAAGVHLIEEKSFPGRVPLLGHCVREIRNRLPGYYPGAVLSKRSRLDYTGRLDGIVKQWRAAGLPLDGSVPPPPISGDGSPQAPTGQVLPPKVLKAVSKLVADHAASRATKNDLARALYAAAAEMGAPDESLNPHVVQWMEITENFMNLTHLRDDGVIPDPPDLEEKFAIFEKALLTLCGSVAEAMDELEAILEDTNS